MAGIKAKAPLTKIAIFGANGRIGTEVTNYLNFLAPNVKLKLLSSSDSNVNTLKSKFPNAEVVTADYRNLNSLVSALENVDGVFVVTPPAFDEEMAMNNLVTSLRNNTSISQIVRLVGFVPEFPRAKFPWERLKTGGGHFIAKDILDKSGLPVTYVNLAATLMDNLFFCINGVAKRRTLVWPDRCTPTMDVRDLGEVIARIFLMDDKRYINSLVTVNNGYDLPSTQETAKMMSEAFLTPIGCETSREAFMEMYGPIFEQRYGSSDKALALLDSFEWEHEHCVWELNQTAERILHRRPNTLFNWFREHKNHFIKDGY